MPCVFDIVVGDLEKAIGAAAAERHSRLHGRQHGILRAEHDVINFPLARREMTVRGNGAGDIGGVAGILAADIHQDNVAILNHGVQFVEVQNRGVQAGAHDGRIGFGFAPAVGVNLHHARGNLVFV